MGTLIALGKDLIYTSGGGPSPTPTPDGKIVIPINDVTIWQECAGITEGYSTMADILADSAMLLLLMGDDNAVDYMVRSTDFISDITSNQNAMNDIGLNNYAANTLLESSDWRNDILNSTYKEGVLNVKVPTMSADTVPEGECFCNKKRSDGGTHPYKGFDNNDTTYIEYDRSPMGQYDVAVEAGYTFPSSKKILSVLINYNVYSGTGSGLNITTLVVQGKVTDGDWMTLKSVSNPSTSYNQYLLLEDNIDYYDSYRIVFVVRWWNNDMARVNTLQFYGREDV